MKPTILLLLTSMIALAAILEVRDGLGFPIPNATVCFPYGCVKTNATGVAEIPSGVAVEIYLNDMLVGKTYSTGHDIVTINRLEALSIQPTEASGYVIVKMVKFLNGTYGDLKIEFRNNNLSRPLPVGSINYHLEIYITEVGNYRLPNATLLKTELWNPVVNLEAAGLVTSCRIILAPPITSAVLYANGRAAARGAGNLTTYLIKGLNYSAVVNTEVLLPNGTSYTTAFQPQDYCGRLYAVNATRLTIRVVDSFGAVRDDWLIKAAGRTYRGQAELWVLPGVVYKVEIDAGFTKKGVSIATRYPSETLIVNIENSYLVLNYLQPPARVYILGNYSVVDRMPRRVELPPGKYAVVVDIGGRNVTYTVTLRPGQVLQLTVGLSTTPQQQKTNTEMTYVFVGVIAVAIVATALLAIKATRRRPQLTRAPSRS
jgi:hypothetical protein